MDPHKFLAKLDFKKPPELTFLKRLTNQTGLIQHAKFAVPDRNLGYSVDDNARALLLCIQYHELFDTEESLDLAVIYLSFVDHAKTSDNWFYNFLTYDNKFLGHAKTEDGYGRVLWALGYTVNKAPRRDITLGARNLVGGIIGNVENLISPRAWCYSLLGLTNLHQVNPDEAQWKGLIKILADKLVALYEKKSDKNWHWFEDYLTYANAIFPYALTKAYQATFNDRYLEIAKESLDFLEKETTNADGIPVPIGQNGWYVRGKTKALFDQQPLDAAKMVLANIELYKVTFDRKYLENAEKWFSWYYGNNVSGLEIYDEVTKGCFDGLTEQGVNLNQGAESIVTYLMAYLAFSEIALHS